MNRKTIAGSSSRAVGPRRTPADADPWLRKTAFSFVQVAPRESKPRQSGLTAIADRGMGLWQIANLIETAGDYIDFAKIAVGMYRLHAEDFIRRKIAAYHKSGIRVFFAGDVSETAMVQGVSGRYYRSLRALGADAVEISSAQISTSLRDRCELVRMAKGEGLLPIAEVGQKNVGDWTISTGNVCRQIEALRDAGAWKLLFQDDGVSRDFDEFKSQFVLDVMSRFDPDDFLFQLKNKESQAWFVNAFGNSVNMSVNHDQILEVELMRRGIRNRGLFGLLGSLSPSAD